MPSKQHEQWKHDLFNHLDRKLSGCVACEFGEARDNHAPTHRGSHLGPSQQILWPCEQMHPHSYDLLRGAGFVVLEQNQYSPVGGRKCRPDITILDTHRQPPVFIEIVRSNRPTNSYRVAEELNIPLFTISGAPQTVARSWPAPVPPLVGLRPGAAGGQQATDVLHGEGRGRTDAPKWRT